MYNCRQVINKFLKGDIMKKGFKIFNEGSRRICEGFGYYDANEVTSFKHLLEYTSKKYGNKEAFIIKNKQTQQYRKVSYIEYKNDIEALGTKLLSLGFSDTRIAVIGENRYEWGVSYFAAARGVGVAVPLDKNLPTLEIKNLIQRGKAEVIFYTSTNQDIMEEISSTDNQIKLFVCMDELPDEFNNEKFAYINDLIKDGSNLIKQGDRKYIDIDVDPEKMTILLFTSGTTALSKGVMLCQRNICSNSSAIRKFIRIDDKDVYLSLLPLHHTMENTVGLTHMLHCGTTVAYCDGIKHIAKNLKEYKVTIFLGVPQLLEGMYKQIQAGIRKEGKEKLVKIMMAVSEGLRKVKIDLRKVFFKSIFDKLGPNLRMAVFGAAPMDADIILGFEKIGLRVIQGYGLTETSPIVAGTNDYTYSPETTGIPIPGVQICIDEPDENGMGELLVKGPNVMLGYYEDEKATNEVIQDGWFRTGDLAIITEEGCTKITGRSKSMIVFANGKKAFPEEYEILLNNHNEVQDCFVWGNAAKDGVIQICAKIIPNMEFLHGKNDIEIAETFEKIIKKLNENIPQYKNIRYFVISATEMVKTTTLKIKRNIQTEQIMTILNEAGMDMRKANKKNLDLLV